MKYKAVMALACAVFLVSPFGCSSHGLIGGDCATGYKFCDGSCISILDDELNCGDCDNACGRMLACLDGLCGGPDGTVRVDELGTGGMGQGGMGGTDGVGGINVGAGGPGGKNGTGSTGGGTGGSGTGGSAPCVPPYNTSARCGSCDMSCRGSTPNCAPDGGSGFECVANCLTDPFTSECSGACVDTVTDPNHCGQCGKVCPSGICVASDCVGTTFGHMVAMCMNFENASPGATNLLANSVFLAAPNPVRILAYTADTSSASRAGTNAALAEASLSKGRAYQLTEVTTSSAVTSQLARTNFDVLMVYDQSGSTVGELAALGTSWSSTIRSFTETGGVVLVMTGGRGTDEMDEFITNIGLFNADSTNDAETTRFYVKSPGDAVGINVVSPFLGVRRTCSFSTSDVADGELVFVTSDDEVGVGNPGVVHRIVVP